MKQYFKRTAALLLTLAMALVLIPMASAAGSETGCAVLFGTDGHAAVDVYHTQDYTEADEMS